jgi:hypothetical protein
MPLTLGLLLVLSGPPVADPDMAPITAAPSPPPAAAPSAGTPGPTTPASPGGTVVAPADATPPTEAPPAEVSEPTTASPEALRATDTAEPSPPMPGEGQSLRDPFRGDPGAMAGWMGYRARSAEPLPPPPPPPPPPATRSQRLFIGGYGGPSARMSSVSRKLSTLAGFRGGVLIGQRLSIGAAAYRLTYRHNSNIAGPDGDQYSLRMGYGGLTAGVTLWRPGRLEFAIEGLVGAGSACISDSHRYSDDDYRCVERINMFVGEPAATMYVNVTPWMRFAVTAGYRIVVREAWRPPNDFILSGGYGGLDLQFGWFKKPPRR